MERFKYLLSYLNGMKTLMSFEIEREKHQKFKAHCALLGETMQDRIVHLILEDVKKSEVVKDV